MDLDELWAKAMVGAEILKGSKMRIARVISPFSPAVGEFVSTGRVEILTVNPEGKVVPTGEELDVHSIVSVSVPESRRVVITDGPPDGSDKPLLVSILYTV